MAASKRYLSLGHSKSRSPESKSITVPQLKNDESVIHLHDRSNLFSNSRRTGPSTGRKRKPQPVIVNNLVKKKPKKQRKSQVSFSSSPIKRHHEQNDDDDKKKIDFNILDAFNKKRYQYDPDNPSSDVSGNMFDYNNSDSETEIQLINLKQLSSSPAKSQEPHNEKEVQVLDKLIATSSNKYKDYMENVRQNDGELASSDDGFAVELMKGNILSTMENRKQTNIEAIRLKYKDKDYPNTVSSKKALLERTEAHLYIIPEILKGKLETSIFYDMAKSLSESSNYETMTHKEKWSVNWQEFFGGYYGFKRQLFIGSIIISRHKNDLLNAANKNKTVSYWTINGFSTFVLANEIIIRFIMQDFDCTMSEAENIIRESSEYGTVISDSTELIDDLNIGELLNDESKEFMKGITLDDTNNEYFDDNKEIEKNPILCEKSNTDVKESKIDILDQFLGTSSDDDD